MLRLTTISGEMELSTEPLLEASFPVQLGDRISSLHGYSLYSALKSQLDWIGKCPHTLINSIPGILTHRKQIETVRYSQLLIRTPLSKASSLYQLAGKTLIIGQGKISLGIPTIAPLQAKSTLKARLVLIHLHDEKYKIPPPDRFLIVATRQLAERGIEGRVSLELKSGQLDLRVIKIKESFLPGYGVRVDNLSEEDSLKLQSLGIGGKLKMGGGFFL